jgi:phosphate transport system substrate-binding protein
MMSIQRSIKITMLSALLVMGLPILSVKAQSSVPRDAGQSSAAPTADKSFRNGMLIVGSSTLQALTEKVLGEMYRSYKLAPATVKPTGTGAGLEQFCGGIGADFPDIAAASRKIRKSEFEECQENGVREIIEIKIGLLPVMVVTRKGDPVFDITPRMFYLALAKELPDETHFEDNDSMTWKDVAKGAPEVKISVILPDETSGSRGFFDDFFLQAGCRHYPGINNIYAATERVPKCIKLRGGSHVIEIPEPYTDKLMGAFAKSPPGTLAVVGELAYLRYKDQLDYLPIAGVLPTRESVSDYSYSMVAFPRYYVKRAHMRNDQGKGVVRGLREFMRILSSEAFAGPGGVFDNAGLNPLMEGERDDVRKAVRRLQALGH